MRCPSCGFDNPEGLKFCNECGTALKRRCTRCGFENAPQAKFCGKCGTTLGAGGQPPPAKSRSRKSAASLRKASRPSTSLLTARTPSASPEAERRQLTVMFCDLVGSTALSAQLDPEEWREVVRAYQGTCAAVVNHYGGHIAQYLGDGLLVYFGYPGAHEDDAQRAARAGLGILAALHNLDARRHRPVQVRIGIHTGLVVVGEIGEGGKRERLALGDTPNLAARLQGLAAPDTVVISAATHRLIEGLLDCRDLGVHALKGVSTPLQVYQVVGENGARSRLEAAATRGLTPLVGREEEAGLLRKRWEQSKVGTGQVVLLSGEAGIGKSRLVQILKEHIATEPHARVEYRCSPYYQNSAFYPLIDHLQRLLQLSREDTPEEKLRKLEQALSSRDGAEPHPSLSLQEVVPLFAALLSLPLPDDLYPPLNLAPQRQKQKTLEALLTWLLTEAERQPVLVVIEDLHWIDPSTLEFLSLLIDQIPTTRLLLLLTSRPDFSPPWAMLAHMTQITLSRLARRQVELMIEKIAGGKTLPVEVVQQLVRKTDGVPLFVEELTKMVVKSGLLTAADDHYELTGPLPPLAIPSTLQDSLMARLDRLAATREVAQVGATLGREFSYELLHAVSPLEEAALRQGLQQLVEAELVYQRGVPPQATYLFKHALIQDAAYQSLLKSTRQQYHRQIAQVLEGQFPNTAETQPELVAYHYTEAGLGAQAVPYWQRAGESAVQRSANVEAITHLTKGLELLAALPDAPERGRQELALRTTLGPALIATKGNAAPEVEHTYARALELCRREGDTPQLFPVLFGLWLFYLGRAELLTTRDIGEQLLTLAQRVQDPALLLEAHRALGASSFLLGEVTFARTHVEQGISLYDPRRHRAHAFLYGQDPGVVCLTYTAHTLWLQGYPDQALKRSQEALTLARELSHPHSLAYALTFCAAWLHQFRREAQAVQERAEESVALCTEQRFPLWLAWGTILRGWVLTERGQREEGIAQMLHGLATSRTMGAELWRPHWLALLAEVYGKGGQAEEGLSVLAEALAAIEKNGERYYEAELYRLKGTLTLQPQVSSPKSQVEKEAEACFHKAIEVARRQQAKSLELRAAMSLARLWQQRGKKAEARQLLAEVYNWFTEGFDTKDLQEAKALVEELGTEEEKSGRREKV